MKKHLKKYLLPAAIGLLSFINAKGQSPGPYSLSGAPDSRESTWVDSLFNEMSEDERLGQLFMIRAHSNLNDEHIRQVEGLIEKHQVGGLCFFQGTPEKQLELSNRYQQLSRRVPLLIAIDAEWGLGMRMKSSTISFPHQLMLGAIQDNRLLYDMGKEIARQLRRVGVQVNFAPVADVNNNPMNPVINTRSFGENRYNVSVKSYMYMKGMQDNNVMACAKHFPGHGDTDVDSHLDLPVINHDWDRLDSIELYPFRALAQHGIGSMMVAHLNVPALDGRENRPTTLSRNTVTRLLVEGLGFEGLIFTDALEMKGVTKHFRSGEVEAEALLAGNDVLVLPEDIETAIVGIKNYLKDGRLQQDNIDRSVKKILRTKYRLGLANFTALPLDSVRMELNSPQALALKRRLIENALTLVRNEDALLPFRKQDSLALASLCIGAKGKTTFQESLDDHMKMNQLQVGKEISPVQGRKLMKLLKDKDAVIVSLHNMGSRGSEGFGITQSTKDFIKALDGETKVILVVFGNPYSLQYFDHVDWVLEAYDEDKMTQELAAGGLFGAIGFRGRLPVTASPVSAFNAGLITKKNYP